MKHSGARIMLAVLVMVAACSTVAFARGLPVMGSVVEPNQSKTPGSPGVMPSEGAAVQIQGTSFTATTDAMGAFRFPSVPEGELTFVVTKPGYAPTIKHYTLKGPMPGQVLVYLTPGGGVNVPHDAVKPDSVYVAFSGIGGGQSYAANTNMPNNYVLNGPPTTTLGTLGTIAYGQNPFTMGGNASLPPGQPPIPGQTPYQTNQNVAENSIMVLDPEQPGKTNYIELGNRAFWVTFNVAGSKLFVSTDQQSINIYDVVNNNIQLGNIPAGGVVQDLVRSGSMIYAPVMATSPGVLVIDPQRNAPVRMIPAPPLSTGQRAHPRSVAVNSDGTRLYVALDAGTAGEVAVIDAFTTRPLGFAKVGAQPLGIAITPDNRYVLVANSKASSVSVIDAFSLQEVAKVPVGIMPTRIAVRPDGTKAYVTCKGDNRVCVINLQTMTPGAIIPVGTNPLGIAVTSNGSHVYVACNGNGTVGIIDGNSDTFLKSTTPQPRSQPYGVAVKP